MFPLPCKVSPVWAGTFCYWSFARLWSSGNPLLAIRCNIAIKLESVHCTLVSYELLSVCQLVTTLGIAVHCNVEIRPESVRCVLVAFRRTSVHCSVTTIDIVVRCNTAIRLKSIRYMLAVSRILFICIAFFRSRGWEQLASALEPKFLRLVHAPIGLIPARCIFVIFHRHECAVSVSRLSPKYRIPTAIGLIPVYCILMAIE